MSINTLLTVIDPPSQAHEQGSTSEWSRIEDKIGTKLPTDYKEYINLFGSGTIAQLIAPFNPFSTIPNTNLVHEIRELGNIYRDLASREQWQYAIFPEPGGLLPWAGTSNGDVLFWITEGDPDTWDVLVTNAREYEFERHSYTMSDFLALLVSNKLSSEVIPEYTLKLDPPLFVSINDIKPQL